ncbi:MAG: RNA polymerase sigma factor [Polyangiaceae bacterium]
MSDRLELLVTRSKAGDRKSAEALIAAVQDDLFRLAMRMLGARAEAQDATQEILLQALTHLSEFRGESAFRTWLWRIAVRHLMHIKRSRREVLASFETLDRLIAQGDTHPALPQVPDAERTLMAREVRLACTQGVLLSLERDQRIAWILSEIFDLSSDEAALVQEIDAPAHRKRLSRARERLETWMRARCGLANGANACRCTRQIPVATAFGVLALGRLEYASRSGPALRIVAEADEIEAAASVLKAHPDYKAPPSVLASIRALIDSGSYRVFDA